LRTPSLMRKNFQLVRSNLKLARASWGELSPGKLNELKCLTLKYAISVALGDIQFLGQGWYVTHAGLLRLAERKRCLGIQVREVHRFCDPAFGRWVFKATVHKSRPSKGFVGYGDANRSNVSSLVHGAELRAAETRAVDRAPLEAVWHGSARFGPLPATFDTTQSGQTAEKTLQVNGSSRQARCLPPRFAGGTSAVSLFISSRSERSRMNSICLFNERCSLPASSISLALRLSGMRIRRRA
jgi:hypothetical protein